ncbi:MAG TPA: hypothetical protein VKT22_02695 [Steroidobacteraceae bacterium]|nr:hypothetical protein [Steroidobacteraceae bacterium]
MQGAARRGVYLLIALGTLPVLLLGVAAVIALFAYAVLEELADSTTGSAPMDESQAREVARRLAMGHEIS